MSPDQITQDEHLDRIIAEQAAYYGLSVERFTAAMSRLAELQEQAEAEGWDD